MFWHQAIIKQSNITSNMIRFNEMSIYLIFQLHTYFNVYWCLGNHYGYYIDFNLISQSLQILKQFQRPLEAMPTVFTAFKHGLTFGASTASCENSFSTLKNVYTEHRLTMLHQRKANLIQLAFEKDLTRKFRNEWKDSVLRRFHTVHKRRLPLY